jgi:UDP-glucose 4-epimerase
MTVYGMEETRSFMYVDDFVKVIQAIYQSQIFQNSVVNVGNDQEIKVKQLASQISGLLNISRPMLDGGNITGSVPRRCPDLSALKSACNIEPTPLEKGLRSTIAYYSEYPPGRMPNKFG